jgi:hypothetical protein
VKRRFRLACDVRERILRSIFSLLFAQQQIDQQETQARKAELGVSECWLLSTMPGRVAPIMISRPPRMKIQHSMGRNFLQNSHLPISVTFSTPRLIATGDRGRSPLTLLQGACVTGRVPFCPCKERRNENGASARESLTLRHCRSVGGFVYVVGLEVGQPSPSFFARIQRCWRAR